MNKITKQLDGTLSVPDIPTVPFITGDGVGEEITPAMRAIVNAAVDSSYGGRRRIEWLEVLAGERAYHSVGSWLPDETMDAFKEYLIGIKGPLTTPVGGGIRSLNVARARHLIYMYAASGALVCGSAFSFAGPGNSQYDHFP